MMHLLWKDLAPHYSKKERTNALIIAVLYQVIGLATLLVGMINIVFLYIPYLIYFLVLALIIGTFITYRGTCQAIHYLKKKHNLITLPYKDIIIQHTIIKGIILFVIAAIIAYFGS